MKLPSWTPREIIAVAITFTIFLVVVVSLVGMAVVGPERVNDKGREILGNIVFALVGMLSSFMSSAAINRIKDDDDKPPTA